MSPQAQFLLFCRLGLGTTEEVFSMCDYGLKPLTHHDALEFSDGQIVLLTDLFEHQEATVLQLPAQSATAAERRPRNGSRTSAGALSVEAPLGMSMEMLTFDTNLGGYRTDITEQQIRGAPAFSRDQTSTNVEAFA